MEDRSRRNNVRLVGLPEGAEGSNAAGFLRVNLSKWIPSLKGHDIEIDRAHCVYEGGRGSDRPHTLIFRVQILTAIYVIMHHQALFFICFGNVLSSLVYGHM